MDISRPSPRMDIFCHAAAPAHITANYQAGQGQHVCKLCVCAQDGRGDKRNTQGGV